MGDCLYGGQLEETRPEEIVMMGEQAGQKKTEESRKRGLRSILGRDRCEAAAGCVA
ncbi:MAG: hypothetical protein K1W22_05080 [Lachnospiraceae bacterium]